MSSWFNKNVKKAQNNTSIYNASINCRVFVPKIDGGEVDENKAYQGVSGALSQIFSNYGDTIRVDLEDGSYVDVQFSWTDREIFKLER
jgi:hypothetical protein